MALDRDAILAADDLPTAAIDVPEWGGTVLLRALNGEQREEVEIRIRKANSTAESTGLKGLRALVATYVVVGEDGQPLFTQKDAPALARKNAGVLERIFEFVLKTNGMTKADAEALAGN